MQIDRLVWMRFQIPCLSMHGKNIAYFVCMESDGFVHAGYFLFSSSNARLPNQPKRVNRTSTLAKHTSLLSESVCVCWEHTKHKQRLFLCLLHKVWLSVSLSSYVHHRPVFGFFGWVIALAVAKQRRFKAKKTTHSMESHFEIAAVTLRKHDSNINTWNLLPGEKAWANMNAALKPFYFVSIFILSSYLGFINNNKCHWKRRWLKKKIPRMAAWSGEIMSEFHN